MKKNVYGYLIVLFAILLAAIGVVQFLRLDYGHRLIPTEKTTTKEFKTEQGSGEKLMGEQMRVYIHQDDSVLSKGAIQNVSYALKYAKIPYENVSTNALSNIKPSARTVLILAGEHTADWPYAKIRDFVDQGGKLYIAGRFADQKWADLVGVKQFGSFVDNVKGLTFEKELFPGYVDLSTSSNLFVHSIIDVQLKKTADVKITAGKHPILWTAPYGKGEVLFWNTSSLLDKNSRGMLLQSLSMMFPSFVSQQVGVKVAHFDDFPAPVPDASSPAIQKNYDMTIKDFFADVWWPDMKRVGEEQDVIYTGFLIGSYKDTTEDTTEQLIENLRFPMLNFGRGLLKAGGEIGLHGFNHQPLIMAGETMNPDLGYMKWKDEKEVKSAIKRAIAAHDYFFPKEKIRSYVPPSNIISKSGLSILNESFPDGLIVASLYIGDASKGSYIQEFGPDPTHQNLYNFPRISSGYNESKEDAFVLADAVANFGIVSHFLHPDDVLDENRSKGKSWPTMEKSLETMFKTVRQTYPFLDSMTQYEAYQKYVLYQKSEIDVSYTKDTIEINGRDMLTPSKMMIRVQQGKLETGEFPYGTVRAFGKSGTLYEVELKQARVSLPIKEDLL